MTIKQLQAVIESTKWGRLKYDSLNWVFVSKSKVDINGSTCYWVLKELQKAGDELGHPINAVVELWNAINPNYLAYETRNGWVSPFLGVARPSDLKIAMEIVNIYRKTRHIIVNAYLSHAFVLLNNHAVCVDLSHAFKGGEDESNHSNRIKQFLVEEFENKLLELEARKKRPLTVATISTLLHWDKQVALKQLITKGTEDTYLIYALIERLHHVSSAHYPITIEHLEFLSKFILHDRFNQFPTQCITPQLIRQINEVYTAQNNVTVEELINQSLTAHSFARTGDSFSLQLVIEEDKSMLNSIDEEGYTLLQIAARYDCIQIVHYLISAGVELNRRTPEAIGNYANIVFAHMTAMDIAIMCKHIPIVLALLNAGAEISPAKLLQSHAIHCVALTDHITQFRALVESNPSLVSALDEDHETPLIKAASIGKKGIIIALLDRKETETSKSICSSNLAHKNWSAVDFAISGGHFHSIALLERAGIASNHKHIKIKNRTLFELIAQKDRQNVEVLLQNNIELLEQVNCEGFTPLQYSAYLGNEEIVSYLVSVGAKLNTRMPMSINRYEQSCYPNFSAVEIAFACEQDVIAYLLLSNKDAQLNDHINGYRHAIHSCAYYGNFELLLLLIESSPSLINAEDSKGLTPVCLAAVSGHSNIVEFLISQSPESMKISIPPLSSDYALEHDSFPLDWAIHGGDLPTIRMLLQAGAPAAHSYTPATVMIDKLDTEEDNSPDAVCIDEVSLQEVSDELKSPVSLSASSSNRTSLVVSNVGFFQKKGILRAPASDLKLTRTQKQVHFIDPKLDILRYVSQKITIEFTRELANNQKTQDIGTNNRLIELCCRILSNQQELLTLIPSFDFKWFRSDFIETLGHMESVLSLLQLQGIDDCRAHLLEWKTQLQDAEQSKRGSSDDELKSLVEFLRFLSEQIGVFSTEMKKTESNNISLSKGSTMSCQLHMDQGTSLTMF